jgi:1-acyl-sn-glycerol-3-phosphate acyltransferase
MARALFVFFVVFAYLFLVGPICIVYAVLRGNADILYRVGRLGCRMGIKLAGIKLNIKGRSHVDPLKAYLFLANHQGNCDPPALLLAIPQNVKFMVKKELNKVPVLNIAMRLGGFVFIDRKDRPSALQGMNQAVAQMQRGDSFLVFPEGTRTRSGKMGPFKKGPFLMALQAGVSILPITISGSYQVMPPTEFRLTPGTITVTFHPKIETRGLSPSSREALMQEVRRTIRSELEETERPILNARN